jgi:ABC-type uncharacterized transport system fused permease/ATPase subunit
MKGKREVIPIYIMPLIMTYFSFLILVSMNLFESKFYTSLVIFLIFMFYTSLVIFLIFMGLIAVSFTFYYELKHKVEAEND